MVTGVRVGCVSVRPLPCCRDDATIVLCTDYDTYVPVADMTIEYRICGVNIVFCGCKDKVKNYGVSCCCCKYEISKPVS